MAVYKLIQDIEAEDHILGPLTLRQFIFALIAAFCFYISFVCLTKGAAFLLILFLPPGLFCAFFAIPFGRDQPTEIWVLAKIRFLFKPRQRLWNQSGVKELVTITAPKKIEAVLTDGLSQIEVKSRLNALANTIDSRGWAIKNVNVNSFAQPNPLLAASSDRLIDIGSIPQEVPSYDVHASDDILDENSNPIAQQFTQMIDKSTQAQRQEIVDKMNAPQAAPAAVSGSAPAADYWFMRQSLPTSQVPTGQVVFDATPLVQPVAPAATTSRVSADDDAGLAAQLHAHSDPQHIANAHLRTLQPLDAQPPAAQPVVTSNDGITGSAPSDPAILSLAGRNDLNVSTLAHEAQKATDSDEPPADEVVIPLH